MWRLAAQLNTVNLQDMTGANLGGLQTAILDLNRGQALYAVLNMTNLAKSTLNASSTSAGGSTPIPNSTSTGANGACPTSTGTSSTGGGDLVVVARITAAG